MQNEDPSSRHQDDDDEDSLHGSRTYPKKVSVLLLIARVVAACFHLLCWLFHWPLRWLRWLLENPIGRAMEECVVILEVVGIFPSDDDFGAYLHGSRTYPKKVSVPLLIMIVVPLLIMIVVTACFCLLCWLLRWLLRFLRWLLKTPIGQIIVSCIMVPVIIGIFLYQGLLYRLNERLNPRIIRMTEKGEDSSTIASPCWLLFENAVKSEVRVCVGNGRGKIPKKLCSRGIVLPPGQKRKIYIPGGSSYDIEVYGMDGQRWEQMKLRIVLPSYED
jgi:hypothetical protein